MTDKEKRCLEELQRCRSNIEREKQFVETHRELLKAAEKKETELLSRLEAIKLDDLKFLINKRGYNIDNLREAMIAGDFSGVIPQNAEKTEADTPNVSSQQEDSKPTGGDTSPLENNKSADTADKTRQSEKDDEF